MHQRGMLKLNIYYNIKMTANQNFAGGLNRLAHTTLGNVIDGILDDVNVKAPRLYLDSACHLMAIMEFADNVVRNCVCIDKTCTFCKTSGPVARTHYNNYKNVVAKLGSLIDADFDYVLRYLERYMPV